MATQTPLDALITSLMNLLLLLMAVFLAVTLILSAKQQRREKPVLRTRLECLRCGYSVEREYKRGDYIGLTEGRCPKCGGPLVVTAVYEVRPGERREEERLLRLVERRGYGPGSRGTR